MSPRTLLVACAALVAAGCSTAAEVEWMKVGQPYTAAEFRRDYTECNKTPTPEDCLRGRGWVSVTAPTAPKQTAPEMRTPPGSGGIGNRPSPRY
jgi:hypothetical protein